MNNEIKLKGEWGEITISSERKIDLWCFLKHLVIVYDEAAEFNYEVDCKIDRNKYLQIKEQIETQIK